MWFWELRETLGEKATPRLLLAPRCCWSWPRLLNRWWRTVTYIGFTGVAWTYHTLTPFLIRWIPAQKEHHVCQLEWWRVRKRWRHRVVGGEACVSADQPVRLSCSANVLKCVCVFLELFVHQSEGFHLHQPGWSRHGSVSLSCRLSLCGTCESAPPSSLHKVVGASKPRRVPCSTVSSRAP